MEKASNFRNIAQKYVEMHIPRISIWKGIVMGAAVGFSFNSTVRIATETTLLALP